MQDKVVLVSLFERIKLLFPGDDIYLIVRDEIQDLVREKYPKLIRVINNIEKIDFGCFKTIFR